MGCNDGRHRPLPGRLPGWGGWRCLAWAAALGASTAAAEVTLDTEVSKVMRSLDAAGRVERELVPVEEVVPGEELRYTITFSNESELPLEPERIVIINPIPDGTVYVPGSAGGEGTTIEYSTDGETWSPVEPVAEPDRAGDPGAGGTGGDAFAGNPAASAADTDPPVQSLRWTYQDELPPGDSDRVFFHVRMQ